MTAVVMKNWEPLVSLPELAMLNLPGLERHESVSSLVIDSFDVKAYAVCLSLKFSSGNLAP